MNPVFALFLLAATLGGCGGGADEADSGPADEPRAGAPLAYASSSSYAGRCANPRPDGTYGDQAGSLALEKYWVRSWVDETYLWYQEVPKVSVSKYADPVTYFDKLKTSKRTATGHPKDRFHFTYPTDAWVALSQGGESFGYGMQIALLAAVPPRRAVIVFTDPGTPAAAQSVRRGAEILRVDGVDLAEGDDVDTLNAGLFPDASGTKHSFVIRDAGANQTRKITLKPARITSTPVQNVKVFKSSNRTVGYLLFNDHIATAEAQLIAAVGSLNRRGPIDDLVLDIRYNGGGYLDIASELAYMIAGASRTRGKVFEKATFNDKNPFHASAADTVTPFHATAQGFSTRQGTSLPSLNAARVFVLTGNGTCSASEAIINGLRGIGVEVVQIGATTCGKPYGFFPADNCGTTYFAVQFKGVNAKGYGDYADGFVPGGQARNGVKGCIVEDDFSHALGDRTEKRLAAALNYIAVGTCESSVPPPSDPSGTQKKGPDDAAEPVLLRPEALENRIYRNR